jgi:flavorubredoxin
MVLKPVEISEGIYWVGAVDWDERDFHSFEIVRGATYNSYLIVDDKIVLVDTVKHKFYREMMERIKEVIDPSQIDYIISNHVETDHSGSLADIKKVARDAVIVCTKRGQDGICKHFECDNWEFRVVKTGDELKTGKKTLMFLEMTMLHWPDSMATYVKENKLLLSNDAFGQHIASVERYDEDLGIEEALKWAKIYYANILMPFGELVKKKLREVEDLGIEIEMIAPSHGVIWKNPARIIDAYAKWANFEGEDKLVIVYDTMWKSTAKLARAIAEGAGSRGVEVRMFHVRNDAWSDIMTEILDAKGVAIGSPTMHNTIFPPVAGFLEYMRSLKPKNKIGFAFGSYGWGGGAVKAITKILESLKFEIIEPFQVKFRPTEDELKRAFEMGEKLAEKIKSKP